MAKRKPALVKLARLEAQTRFIKAANRLALLALCGSVGFVVIATAFPQRRALKELQAKLEETRQREAAALAEKDYLLTEHRALREDPEFLELHARDRLDLYREGERVLKFSRDR